MCLLTKMEAEVIRDLMAGRGLLDDPYQTMADMADDACDNEYVRKYASAANLLLTSTNEVLEDKIDIDFVAELDSYLSSELPSTSRPDDDMADAIPASTQSIQGHDATTVVFLLSGDNGTSLRSLPKEKYDEMVALASAHESMDDWPDELRIILDGAGMVGVGTLNTSGEGPTWFLHNES